MCKMSASHLGKIDISRFSESPNLAPVNSGPKKSQTSKAPEFCDKGHGHTFRISGLTKFRILAQSMVSSSRFGVGNFTACSDSEFDDFNT